jgi:hypothetical protein
VKNRRRNSNRCKLRAQIGVTQCGNALSHRVGAACTTGPATAQAFQRAEILAETPLRSEEQR